MPAQPKQALSEEGYLAIERAADSKSEFFDGEMVAMAGARASHNAIAFNVMASIGNRMPGSCRGYSSDMKVRVLSGRFDFYPDVVVACGEPVFLDSTEDVLLNPVLIVEVLSKSTEVFDRERKFDLYRMIPSLKAYLLIAQDLVHVDLHVRQSDKRKWLPTSASTLEDTFDLAPIGCKVPLAEVYKNVWLAVE